MAKQTNIQRASPLVSGLFSCPRNLWSRVTPISNEAATCAPSSCAAYFDVLNEEIEDDVMDHINRGLSNIFKHSYNNTSVDNYITEIVFALSGPLVSFKDAANESTIREGLLLPVLSRILTHINMIPSTKEECDSSFTIHLLPEDKLCFIPGKRGRRPEVDYVISIEKGETIKMHIPVETKRVVQVLHVKQLASYMNKIGTATEFRNQTITGILIDTEVYRLAFAPLKDSSNRSLPIVYVSPPTPWRHPALHPLSLNNPAIFLLSLVQVIEFERMVANGTTADPIRETCELLYSTPYCPLRSHILNESSVGDLVQTVLIQQEELKDKSLQLEDKNRQLEDKNRQLEQKDLELQKKIDEIYEMVSPKHPPAKRPHYGED